ncbi:MAG: hypothetical protein BroJett018_16470 [Chloroflexota bacterium]|nr:hypothetical protein [Chloroflexota bacterium]GIK63853.1 MAG: hypothetical protein BroJett018_16470 [Chloroflexota bacterium]
MVAAMNKCPVCGAELKATQLGWRGPLDPDEPQVRYHCDDCDFTWDKADLEEHWGSFDQGFYTEVDGQAIHVLGDPNMSEETFEALKELARLAMKAVDENTLLDSDENEA